MKRVLGYLKPYAASMTWGGVIKFIGTIMDLCIPWILAYMVDTIVPTKQVRPILLWGFLMIVCSVIALVGNVAANRMASRVARDTTRRLRHDLFCKILHLSCGQVDAFTVPSLVSRLSSDTYNVHQMFGMMQRVGVRAPILLLGGILVTLTLDPVLTLVMVAVLPFICLVVGLVSKHGIPLYRSVQKTADRLVRVVQENAAGIRVIKALSKTEYEKGRFEEVNREVFQKEIRAGNTMSVTSPMMNLLLNTGLILVILAGAFRVSSGATQPGKIIAFLSYFTIILNAMIMVTRIFMTYSKASASAARITEVLDAPEKMPIMPDDTIPTEDHISFNHVFFSYLGKQHDVEDIDFHLKRGETLGVIGATGSGKSTILALLLRFYDADQGVIRLNGRDIRSIPREIYHTKFGVVFQNDFLFADTIRENVAFGRTLRAEQLEQAVRYAQAGFALEDWPEGLEHPLTIKASNLSGGQKQRLLIARALAADPEILILDDSSSALDYRTDANLRRTLAEAFPHTTTILIAQRISSLQNADHILMLEEGRIVGSGTHKELLETCEAYRAIYQSQMGEREASSL